MCSRLGVLEQDNTCKMRQPQTCLSGQFDPQHRNGYRAPLDAGSVYLAITQNELAKDSFDWYLHARWLVSHESPIAYSFTTRLVI